MERQKHVVFAGSVDVFHEWCDVCRARGERVVVDALFSDGTDEDVRVEVAHRGAMADVLPYLEEHQAPDGVFCCMDLMGRTAAMELFYLCEEKKIRFCAVPACLPFVHRRMTIAESGRLAMLVPSRTPVRDMLYALLKRAADMCVSLLFLLVVFPFVYIWMGVRIKRKSPGPVFARERKVGKDGRIFRCLTFRRTEEETEQCIDRLPMFLNVFFGEMSLVGPRVRTAEEMEEYRRVAENYRIRRFAKPGLTGWAQQADHSRQACRRNSLENEVLDDFFYVQNATCALDVCLLWRAMTGRRH